MFVQPRRFYGFLTHLEGDPRGPWILSFDVTDRDWFHDVVENRLSIHYRVDRIEAVIGRNDYFTAWDSGIAVRNFLRHAYEEYRRLAGAPGSGALIGTYEIMLSSDDAQALIRRPPGQGSVVDEGQWYGLDLVRCRLNVAATPEIGMLCMADRDSDALGAAEAWRLSALHELSTAPAATINGPFNARPIYFSQAVLQALHFARGE